MLYCPIVQQYNCHPNCLFLRSGGCSMVLAATISDSNEQKIKTLEYKLDQIVYNQSILERKINILINK
ncbi:MAG: hypothetical protein Q8O59_01670 [bacterium]|nr:hypothetical protein [bacterium]